MRTQESHIANGFLITYEAQPVASKAPKSEFWRSNHTFLADLMIASRSYTASLNRFIIVSAIGMSLVRN